MHRFMPSSRRLHRGLRSFYCARASSSSNAGGVHGLADEHEDIKVVVLSFAEAMSLARGDKIKNGLTVPRPLLAGARAASGCRRAWSLIKAASHTPSASKAIQR